MHSFEGTGSVCIESCEPLSVQEVQHTRGDRRLIERVGDDRELLVLVVSCCCGQKGWYFVAVWAAVLQNVQSCQAGLCFSGKGSLIVVAMVLR